MNQVGLVGRLTKDPVLRQVSENRNQTSFALAINRSYRNAQGTIDTDFVLCVAWGKVAERITQYCGKGSLIGISGRIQTRSFLNKENMRVYMTEVVADEVRFYSLKSPTDKKENEVLTVEKTNKEIEAHFELPKKEESLPIT